MASTDNPVEISEEDESPQLWTDAELEEQRRRDAECEERLKALEEESIKAADRRLVYKIGQKKNTMTIGFS